ncbi:hypothetical protein ABGB16_22565 [Micromonospora sp. B11E3]|uniref:hypothetical protein n=1 Tax=Micromonospora sp. B11E3 TaxID=3153562 RepID=UPI00325EBAB7
MTLPVPNDRRVPNYLRQSGRPELTPRQRRRAEQKKARLDGLTGRSSPKSVPGR